LIYGVIGDIHSNYEALSAVVDALQHEHVDKILCVGDIVGYAAEPIKCIELIQELHCITVVGNHDSAVVGKFPIAYFNNNAQIAAKWTAQQLSEQHVQFLKKLPLVEVWEGITIVHASLNRPEFFDYITTTVEAELTFDKLNTPVCFYGHTHIPTVLFLENGMVHIEEGRVFDLSNVEKVLINVGSVGQPRDWDLRACCAIYDSEKKTVRIERVKYNIHDAMEKIFQAGLPRENALRLME